MLETDRQKFIRLAEKRVSRAINTIRLIGNLSNTSNYEYTKADVEKIFSVLNEEIKTSKSKFVINKNDSIKKFSLD